MPAVFFGHGNPMNAIQDNAWTRSWAAIGAALSRPKAVLCVSAHWYLPATAVTAVGQPRTIHDFGGFPPELHQVQYRAPGAPELAHVYPEADTPVVQLSIDETQPASWHYESAKKLAPLRDEGVLVMGSGNLVHNLHTYSWGNTAAEPYDWAMRFETLAREAIRAKNFAPLVGYESLGRDAMLSAPTPDHYLPLLYVLAQHLPDDSVSFPVEGFDGGSISMLAVQLG